MENYTSARDAAQQSLNTPDAFNTQQQLLEKWQNFDYGGNIAETFKIPKIEIFTNDLITTPKIFNETIPMITEIQTPSRTNLAPDPIKTDFIGIPTTFKPIMTNIEKNIYTPNTFNTQNQLLEQWKSTYQNDVIKTFELPKIPDLPKIESFNNNLIETFKIPEIPKIETFKVPEIPKFETFKNDFISIPSTFKPTIETNSLGHHRNRCHDVPGEKLDRDIHQEIHNQEKIALNELKLPGNAFDKAYGNSFNKNNLPPRRQYGNIIGKKY